MEELFDRGSVGERDGWVRRSPAWEDGSSDVFGVELTGVGFVHGDDVACAPNGRRKGAQKGQRERIERSERRAGEREDGRRTSEPKLRVILPEQDGLLSLPRLCGKTTLRVRDVVGGLGRDDGRRVHLDGHRSLM